MRLRKNRERESSDWVTVPNKLVRHVFVCDAEGCPQTKSVNTRKLIAEDVPVCPDCDTHMSLESTQLLVKKDKSGLSVKL